ILGTMIYGTIGCILFFGILGNFGLYLQLSDSFDVISHMNEFGAPAAIIAILHQLPLAKLIVPLFTILAIIFLATTFDSSSYIPAAVEQKGRQSDTRLCYWKIWPLSLCFLPLVLMFINDFKTMQTGSIYARFPVNSKMLLSTRPIMKASKQNVRETQDYE